MNITLSLMLLTSLNFLPASFKKVSYLALTNMAVSIAIEGSEGGGKSFLSSLVKTLIEENLHNPILLTAEPGGTDLGYKIRDLLKSEKYRYMHPVASVLLFNSSRAELFFKQEKPFLESNPTGILVKERCWLSTMVYQKIEGADASYIEDVMRPFVVIPDSFAILDCPVMETQVRVVAAKKSFYQREIDWRDVLPAEDLTGYRNAYLDFAEKNRQRCFMLDCFDEPWDKAARIGFMALNMLAQKEGRTIGKQEESEIVSMLTEKARIIVETREGWATHLKKDIRLFPIEELREQTEEARTEMNFPSKEELRLQMHADWKMRGLEGFSSGIERGK